VGLSLRLQVGLRGAAEVPAYARPLEGAFGRGLRAGAGCDRRTFFSAPDPGSCAQNEYKKKTPRLRRGVSKIH